MTLEPLDIETEIDPDVELLPVEFKSTGNKTRDKGIIGIMADAPLLVKALNKAKAWDRVCESVNPMGEAEKFAVQNCGITLADEQVIPVLKKVKTLLLSGHDSVIQTFQKSMLESHVKRVDVNRVMSVVKKNVVGSCKLVGNILTNTDGQTYEFGKRGKPPTWVSEWKAANQTA